MTQVRVQRISSVTDPYAGLPAKQIEFVEVKNRSGPQAYQSTEESKMVQGIMSQFQSMGIFPQARELSFPKITMVLTESEYDMLGMRLDVNEVYELEIKNGTFAFKPTEGA
jgi:hypothetical protein